MLRPSSVVIGRCWADAGDAVSRIVSTARVRWRGRVTGVKTDAAGVAVLTRLDEATLQQIARAGNGRYFNAGQTDVGTALSRELDLLETARFERELQSRSAERFQWFLGAALIALAASQFMPERTRGRRRPDAVAMEAS